MPLIVLVVLCAVVVTDMMGCAGSAAAQRGRSRDDVQQLQRTLATCQEPTMMPNGPSPPRLLVFMPVIKEIKRAEVDPNSGSLLLQNLPTYARLQKTLDELPAPEWYDYRQNNQATRMQLSELKAKVYHKICSSLHAEFHEMYRSMYPCTVAAIHKVAPVASDRIANYLMLHTSTAMHILWSASLAITSQVEKAAFLDDVMERCVLGPIRRDMLAASPTAPAVAGIPPVGGTQPEQATKVLAPAWLYTALVLLILAAIAVYHVVVSQRLRGDSHHPSLAVEGSSIVQQRGEEQVGALVQATDLSPPIDDETSALLR